MNHRREFRGKNLAGAFSRNLGYGFEKMGEGIRNLSVRSSIGKWGLENTIDAVKEFKKLLDERGMLKAYTGSIVPLLKELEYPFSNLMSFYSGESTKLNDQDAEIFAFYVEAKVEELKELAIEIDKEHESDKID